MTSTPRIPAEDNPIASFATSADALAYGDAILKFIAETFSSGRWSKIATDFGGEVTDDGWLGIIFVQKLGSVEHVYGEVWEDTSLPYRFLTWAESRYNTDSGMWNLRIVTQYDDKNSYQYL